MNFREAKKVMRELKLMRHVAHQKHDYHLADEMSHRINKLKDAIRGRKPKLQ